MIEISIEGTVGDDHIDVLVETIKDLANRLRMSDTFDRPITVTQDFATLGLSCSGTIRDGS